MPMYEASISSTKICAIIELTQREEFIWASNEIRSLKSGLINSFLTIHIKQSMAITSAGGKLEPVWAVGFSISHLYKLDKHEGFPFAIIEQF